MAPLCLVVLEINASLKLYDQQTILRLWFICRSSTNLDPASNLSASHNSSEPFSKPPAITPRLLSSEVVQAISLKLVTLISQHAHSRSIYQRHTYPESVSNLASGCSSSLASSRSRPRSHSSRHVLLEKSMSTAPARVPVAINGDAAPGDQAKVAVLGISLRRTMMMAGEICFGEDRDQ